MLKIHHKEAKTLFHKTNIPDAAWSINHYIGCQHACTYCYARFIGRWRKQQEKWGKYVDIKVNAAELAKKESKSKRGSVILCTCSDPYQPIERRYKLTRNILKVLNKNLFLCILTKSDLVTQDIDLFKQFKRCEIGVTITTFDKKLAHAFEPFAPDPKARLAALKKLHESGLKTYCFIGPIFPYLTDLEDVFKKTAPYVDFYYAEDLNFSIARKSILETLGKHYPLLEKEWKRVPKDYWLNVRRELRRLAKKYDRPIKIFFKSLGKKKQRPRNANNIFTP